MMTFEEFQKKRIGKKIIFTNGCFDILHVGHATYLAEAQSLGDLLVVGINSDASVRRLKGQERPINNQDDRAKLLSHLKSVDYVEVFDQDTPLELILKIRPDVLVKGGDWAIDKIVGAKEVLSWGGEVKNLVFVPGKSSTSIIDKIKSL